MSTSKEQGGSPSLIAFGRYASIALSLLTVPIVARVLGPEGRGVSATMIAVVTIATVLVGLGVPLVLRRRVAEGESLTATLSAGRMFALLTLLPSLILGFAVNFALFRGSSFPDQVAFIVSMSLIPLSVSWAQDVSVLVATRQFHRMAILGVLQAGTMFTTIVVLWLTASVSIAGVVYASSLGNIAAFAVGLLWLRSGLGQFRLMRQIAAEGWTLIGAQLADVSTRRLDQVIALPLLGPVGAGLYSVAATVSSLSTPIAHATAAAMFKGMTGEHAADNGSGALTMRYGFALGTLLVIPMAIASVIGIPILFGEEYRDAIIPTLILCAAVPATIATYCGATWMAAQKHGLRLTAIQIVTVVALVAGFFVLSAPLAVIGAALGVCIALFVSNAMVAHAVAARIRETVPRWRDFPAAIRILLRG